MGVRTGLWSRPGPGSDGSFQSSGFELSYLEKVSEVKDTVRRQPLLHHLCALVLQARPDSSDLYSEIPALARCAKVSTCPLLRDPCPGPLRQGQHPTGPTKAGHGEGHRSSPSLQVGCRARACSGSGLACGLCPLPETLFSWPAYTDSVLGLFSCHLSQEGASLVAQMVKNLAAMQETQV